MNQSINPNQQIEQNAYVPTYRIRPEFHKAVLGAIGKYPFNQIQAIMHAINVPIMDHNTLQQVMNALGGFPYEQVAGLLTNINNYIEMVEPEEPASTPPPADFPPEVPDENVNVKGTEGTVEAKKENPESVKK